MLKNKALNAEALHGLSHSDLNLVLFIFSNPLNDPNRLDIFHTTSVDSIG